VGGTECECCTEGGREGEGGVVGAVEFGEGVGGALFSVGVWVVGVNVRVRWIERETKEGKVLGCVSAMLDGGRAIYFLVALRQISIYLPLGVCQHIIPAVHRDSSSLITLKTI
jgi:hypothetical protein